MKNIFITAIVISLAAAALNVQAQDIHFSQYDVSPVVLNPAHTGMYNDSEYRATNQYRNQWDALIRKSYMSEILSFDMPFKDKWGLGGYIINDNSARVYNSFTFVASGAHDITIDEADRHKLSVGLQLGMIYKTTRTEEYLFDNQYTDGRFDPELPTGENFEKNWRIMPEINMGVAYRNNEENKQFSPYGGIAVFHIMNPKDNLTTGEVSRLPIKFVFQGGCKYFLNDRITLDPKLLIMRQRNAMEYDIGALSYFQLQDADFHLIGGINYRYKDAVVTTLGIYYRNFIYRVSYDFNVSKLREFSSYKGGLEFSLIFLKQKAKSIRLL
ncbi:MAG: PorP/SprF family type IX secretion system membrane protein [Bacteroidota bacterium]